MSAEPSSDETEKTEEDAASEPPSPGISARTQAWINVAAGALLLLLFGGDLLDGYRAERAEVSAMETPPRVLFAAVAVTLTLVAGGISAWGFLKGRTTGFRGHRLLPILASILLFIDLLVLNEGMGFPAHEMTAAALGHLEQRASHLSQIGQVASDPEVLEPLLVELGRPPYLVRGEPLEAWTLELRHGCTAPVVAAEGRPAGTIFYCVSEDQGRAWLTAVGLEWTRRFGAPEIVASGRGTVLRTAEARPMESPLPMLGGPDAFREGPRP